MLVSINIFLYLLLDTQRSYHSRNFIVAGEFLRILWSPTASSLNVYKQKLPKLGFTRTSLTVASPFLNLGHDTTTCFVPFSCLYFSMKIFVEMKWCQYMPEKKEPTWIQTLFAIACTMFPIRWNYSAKIQHTAAFFFRIKERLM